ncbi:MAG: hypothetical protein IPK19_19265 [Chloroflexi bacterium]|nr:hypothetical protein [Chloroflexota bacterium]
MSIDVHWDNEEKDVVVALFDGEWTWNDFHDAVQRIHVMVASVEQTVDILLFHKVDQPLGNPLINFEQSLKNQPPNTGRVIVINTKINRAAMSFAMRLAAILTRIYPRVGPVVMASSVEEARAMLDRPDHFKPAGAAGAR